MPKGLGGVNVNRGLAANLLFSPMTSYLLRAEGTQ
jgi:hypothetical protein